MIDLSTEFGQRVSRRLQEEPIIWLTTTSSDGTPQPRPVWFLWTGEEFLVFSQAEGRKLKHIARNPRVSLNLDGDGHGGDIVVFTGEARVVEGTVPAENMAAYVEKYREGFARIGMTPDQFAGSYALSIRVTPTKLRGH